MTTPSQSTASSIRTWCRRRPWLAEAGPVGAAVVAGCVAGLSLLVSPAAAWVAPQLAQPTLSRVSIQGDLQHTTARDDNEPSSPGSSGTAQGSDQQPQRVCTEWDPEHNTTHEVPC